MYALLRGVGGLSAGTRVDLLSHPTVNPVRVRTISPIPRMEFHSWKDHNGSTQQSAVKLGEDRIEFLCPRDNLVKLRKQTRSGLSPALEHDRRFDANLEAMHILEDG